MQLYVNFLFLSRFDHNIDSHQDQSSTQQDEVAQTAATVGAHTKTLFCWDCEESVLQQNVLERKHTISMQGHITASGETISFADYIYTS